MSGQERHKPILRANGPCSSSVSLPDNEATRFNEIWRQFPKTYPKVSYGNLKSLEAMV